MIDRSFRRSFAAIAMSAVMALSPLSSNIVLATQNTGAPQEASYDNEVKDTTVSGEAVSAGNAGAVNDPVTLPESDSDASVPEVVVNDPSSEGPDGTVSSDEAVSGNSSSDPEQDPGDSSDFKIPVGVLGDNTVIDNPVPLPQYAVHAPSGAKAGEESAAGAGYASSYQTSLPSLSINQGNSELCWAFAASMLGSINHLKKTGETVRYSPDQIGYFFYNRVDDPMHNTSGDSNYIMGGAGYNYYNRGGNNSFNTWSLASWISPRVYSELEFENNDVKENLSQTLAYTTPLHLQNAYWSKVDSPEGNIGYVENVKELIHDHGAVSATIYSGRPLNNKNASYTTVASGGHNIVLVGWDDNFSKDNFDVTPPGDGAWYVRDSYDGGTNIKADGCYWLSYYDRGLTGPADSKAIAFDFDNGNNYDNNYQYDGSAGNTYIHSGRQDLTVANVFKTGTGNEKLRAVSFAPFNTSTDYTVKIYSLPDDYTDPTTGGTLLYTQSGSTRYAGYRTIVLDHPVSLNANQCFSVVIEVMDTSGGNDAKVFVEMSAENGGWVGFTAGLNEKQSYAGSTDLYGSHYCVRIKAFTDNVKAEKAKATYSAGDYTYDGTVHKPTVTVKKGEGGTGDILTVNSDYTVEYENAVNAGTATVKIKSNNYTIVNDTFTYEIKSKTINDANITASLSQTSFPYDGTAKTPAVEVNDTSLSKTLVQGEDYDLEYVNNVDAGTATVLIKGTNNYKDQKSLTFTITGKDFTETIVSAPADVTYNGSPQIPQVSVKDKNGTALTEGKDYVVSATNNVNAGTGNLAVSGKGNYTGTKNVSFKILPKSAAELSVAGIESSYNYTGSAITPEPVVTDPGIGGKQLSKGSDYSVDYSNNKEEGYGQVIIKGAGNYTGEKQVGFFISKAPALDLTVGSIPDKAFVPGGDPIRPAVTVKYNGTVLNEGGDYYTVYKNNTSAGTATVDIIGIPKTIYDNSRASTSFTISPFSLKSAEVSGISDQLFVDGKTYTVSPNVTVRSPLTGQMVNLQQGEDYVLSYEDNTGYKKDQKVTVFIDGIGNYTGSITKSFSLRNYVPIGDDSCFDIKLSQYEYDYDGQAKKPAVTVIYKPENRQLSSGTDYKVTYSANKNAGNGKVTIKPSSAFTKSKNVKGTAVVFFSIKGKTANNVVLGSIPDKVYTGKPIKPAVKVYESGKKLSSSSYYVEYSGNVNAGTARYTVYGKKNYSGVLAEGTFVIKKRSFSSVKTSYSKSTGTLTVKYGNAILRENVDYKNDASAKVLTSLQTNFEAGTKKYK